MTESKKDSEETLPYLARYLRPERFDVEPTAPAAGDKWSHWLRTFNNFLTEHTPADATDTIKLKLLANHLTASIFIHIKDCQTYDTAIALLNKTYVKPVNEILARYVLGTRKQKQDETISDYCRALNLLAQKCSFKSVSAEEHREQAVRSAFIAGILSSKIRERLLERSSLSMDEAYNQAVTLETAEKDSETMGVNIHNTLNALPMLTPQETSKSFVPDHHNAAVPSPQQSTRRCFFCGGKVHQRIKCPAYHAYCQLCTKKGHFASVCRSRGNPSTSNAIPSPIAPVDFSPYPSSYETVSTDYSAASPSSLEKATIAITVNNTRADALIDTGSSVSFIDRNIARMMKLQQRPYKHVINLASLSHTSSVDGVCFATLEINNHVYKQRPLLVIDNLCADVIVGHDILKNHSKLEFQFGGTREPLHVCVMEASVPPASIFTHLSADITPIAIKSRRHNNDEEQFIQTEISKLLKDGIIESSVSPWRAQVLVAGGGAHRKRMVIDYSRTINKFTYLDAYPLPNVESIVSKVAKFNHFSQIDLKSAYHQVPILAREKIYTAFEACGKLWQFKRIPFGVTNGVAAFQRTLEHIIEKEQLHGTFAYLDDVTVCGKNKEEHDINLHKFMSAAKKYKLTLNEQKCNFSKKSISLLGYTVNNNVIEPDKDRLEPLRKLPLPRNIAELKRALGLFAHYAKWVHNFSAKIQPLINNNNFPLNENAQRYFQILKSDIEKAALVAIDDKETLTVETDASEFAIAATLSQKGRPVAFFSRTLSDSERKHASVEKEACAIVESLRKWRHYLIHRHFLLITDQKSVSYIFDQNHTSKIKNDKIERWRLELSCYKYDIIYRPGIQNNAADALSRVCAFMSNSKLYELHDALSHPGITRMYHWIKLKNLPYSINDVKQMTASCRVCSEIKPRFAKAKGTLIKALSPFERLNIDFKGPLPSNTNNKYILTIIDEFSRYPFAYACPDTSSATVIKCLRELFYEYSQPLYIHSDRGSSFMSEEIQTFLRNCNIATSRTTPYNPQGNGQVEKLNGTLWRTIQLSLRSKNLPIENWEQVLKPSLHCVRSLLCTSINATPHEKLFNFPRRTPVGESLPSWLIPGPILLKKFVRSKTDPYVEEAELIHSNPSYSYVRRRNGQESTVSNRHLAPLPISDDEDSLSDSTTDNRHSENTILDESASNEVGQEEEIYGTPPQDARPPQSLRKSSRTRTIPIRLNDYILGEENPRGGE